MSWAAVLEDRVRRGIHLTSEANIGDSSAVSGLPVGHISGEAAPALRAGARKLSSGTSTRAHPDVRLGHRRDNKQCPSSDFINTDGRGGRFNQ